jgi:hypothetical protein
MPDFTDRYITAAPLREDLVPVEEAAARLRGRIAALLVKLETHNDSQVGRARILKTAPKRILDLLGDADQVFYELQERL